MRGMKLFVFLMLAVMLVTACTPQAPAPGGDTGNTGAAPAAGGELKVGVILPLSGANVTFGTSAKNGVLLAIEEWNAKGGVAGHKIVPVIEDGQCNPEPSVNAANKLIDQDGVKFIVGEVCSKATIPVTDIGTEKKVLVISGTSTNALVTVDANGATKPYAFRACFIDPFQGQVGAKFAFEKIGAKKAFLMIDQANDYVKGLAEEFEKAFTGLGGEIVGTESYTSKDTDFSTILAKIAETKPDLVYLPDYYNIVNLVTKQAKEQGITAVFMGGDGWDSTDLDLKSADGGYFTNHYSPEDQRPEVANFLKNYEAVYKDDKGNPIIPDSFAALNYDAANVLFNAIEAAGSVDVDKVKTALEDIKYNGVSGAITYDDKHNPVKSATILKVTADGVKFDSVVAP
ncbi:MAG TPA: ABC transporter substrate-binding protein [Bellilinea sp.]|nr:ABC transporter substrate-binding protein [Bellilinea sp.]